MKKIKICCIITARPSYSRVKALLDELKNDDSFELELIVTSSALIEKNGKVVDFIKRDGFNVYAEVHTILESSTLANSVRSVGMALFQLPSIVREMNPDAIITIADRYETISNAITSSYMNIPLIHIQGGEVSGSIDNKVRHAITKLSDIHFVSTELSRERVVKMGENPKKVFNTGCPSVDLARIVDLETKNYYDLLSKNTDLGINFSLEQKYIVVLQHPDTMEYLDSESQIINTLNAVTSFNLPLVFFWPNIDAGSDTISKQLRKLSVNKPNLEIKFIKNLDGLDFLRLLKNCSVLVGNSSVGVRECSYLGVPVVNIGKRQHHREKSNNLIDVDYKEDEIKKGIEFQLNNKSINKSNLYGDGYSSSKIVEILKKINYDYKKYD